MLHNPQDVCLDKRGNFYIADFGTNRIRKVDISGTITTVAGGGTSGVGDGGAATAAQLVSPYGVVVDDTGNIYIGENSSSSISNRVRKVDTFGIITTVAGNGTYSYIGDGIPATSAQISPVLLNIDNSGQLWIVDQRDERIFVVDHMGIIHSFVGNGTGGFAGDGGPATAAELYTPDGVIFDICGNIYVPEASNRRIRKITYSTTTPVLTLSAPTSSAAGSTVTLSATVTGGCCAYTDSILWMDNGVVFARTTTTSVTFTKTMQTDSISAVAIGCGDTATSSVYVITRNTTGLPGVGTGGLSCYPNPATSQLYVSAPADIESIVVTNLVGQVVVASAISHGQSAVFDINALPAGVYFVKVNNLWLQRFVKR